SHVDINAAFANLSLRSTPGEPDEDTCLAHLKLLFAIQSMKDDVGYTDGLWGLWDTLADNDDLDLDDVPSDDLLPGAPTTSKKDADPDQQRKVRLSKLREKRWALFVARAVDRYESWWNHLPKTLLREEDMYEGTSSAYSVFVEERRYIQWAESMLPPLDVLMVWHAHMLNPRAYLEDTLRIGVSLFWATGMPWGPVSSAIDNDFNYNPSDDAKASFVAKTGRAWDNAEDSLTKNIKCPACQAPLEIPWTTCGRDEAGGGPPPSGLVGNGYGDGELLWSCHHCAVKVDKKLLSVAKFVKDAQSLVVNSTTMPGTVLEPTTGVPKPIPAAFKSGSYPWPRTFPNRLIRQKLIVPIAELIRPGMSPNPTMETVRDLIEQVLSDRTAIRQVEGGQLFRSHVLPATSRICVRKMMSRYWENSSPFALDLGGAVMRQGIFTAKMFQIDWLHSPNARGTMARLVNKYHRFMTLMRDHPNKTCVPTLDIDLAWHTHQLAPYAYYRYTITSTVDHKFVDHDDKMAEDKLATGFDWTTRAYQDKYGEVYSECTCWYCETIRSSNTGSVSRMLGMSTQEKVAQNFHDSGRAKLCPPDKSAHISAHNAVRQQSSDARDTVRDYLRERQYRQLELDYQKACKRAQKKGRTLPPRDEYYNHWGYSYYMYSPFLFPMYFTPGLYYGWNPGFIGGGAGAWGGCAQGSCSAGVAAGACGGPGGC
ncbi:hypothetical protein M406DRAFT_226915, partial [Cryphonectria parasitica EP155]